MPAAEITAANAAVTAINGASAIGLTASRVYLLDQTAIKLATSAQCAVMITSFTEERDSRATSRETLELGVVVYQKTGASDNDTLDGLIEKLRLIRKLMLGKTLGSYRVRRVGSDPLYDEELLRSQLLFVGYVSIFADAVVDN